jgi:hypothetical protein
MSNGVINLSADKPKVFPDALRCSAGWRFGSPAARRSGDGRGDAAGMQRWTGYTA